MKFSEVLEALRNGERLTNSDLSYNGSWIARHIPTYVENEIIPKMNSLPEGVKDFLKGRGDLRFEDQVLLFSWSPMQEAYIVTSYTPSWSDIFRPDWTIC